MPHRKRKFRPVREPPLPKIAESYVEEWESIRACLNYIQVSVLTLQLIDAVGGVRKAVTPAAYPPPPEYPPPPDMSQLSISGQLIVAVFFKFFVIQFFKKFMHFVCDWAFMISMEALPPHLKRPKMYLIGKI